MSDTGIILTDALPPLADYGLKRLAVALGVFDGLHIGHQRIIRHLLDTATNLKATPVLVTFEPHPLEILNPDAAPARILAPDYQGVLLTRMGIKARVSLPFSREFAQLSPESFVREYLIHPHLQLVAVCVGENWRFGQDACGGAATLRALGRTCGFELEAVPELFLDQERVSATAVRQAVAAGQLDHAERLLGRRFAVYGRVQKGRGIAGTKLQCATANIELQSGALPPRGIYAARVRILQNTHPAILYLGRAPTFPDAQITQAALEVHILDFTGDLYGKCLEVEFLDFIREDRKFSTPLELRAQIARDIDDARQIHAKQKNDQSTNI